MSHFYDFYDSNKWIWDFHMQIIPSSEVLPKVVVKFCHWVFSLSFFFIFSIIHYLFGKCRIQKLFQILTHVNFDKMIFWILYDKIDWNVMIFPWRLPLSSWKNLNFLQIIKSLIKYNQYTFKTLESFVPVRLKSEDR